MHKPLLIAAATLVALMATTSLQADLMLYHELDSVNGGGQFVPTVGANLGTPEGTAALDTTEKKIGAGSVSANSFGSDRVDLGNFEMTGWTGLTISAWVNYDGFSDENFVFGNSANGNGQVNFRTHDTAGYLRLGVQTDGWDIPQTTGQLTANTWQHVAASWQDDEIKIYIDGNVETFTPATGATLTRGGVIVPAAIGAYSGNQYGSDGNIDDLAVWDEVLTETQIQGLANQTLTPLTVPEPATFCLAALGLLGLRRRRSCRGS